MNRRTSAAIDRLAQLLRDIDALDRANRADVAELFAVFEDLTVVAEAEYWQLKREMRKL
jgi:glutaredoxin 2